jgi:hypothetical protein
VIRLAIATFIFFVAGSLGAAAPPPIRRVFVIVLETRGFDATFGADVYNGAMDITT